MAEIHNIDDHRPHIVVNDGAAVHVIGIHDIRSLADGRLSIAEFENPESMARALAALALSAIDGN